MNSLVGLLLLWSVSAYANHGTPTEHAQNLLAPSGRNTMQELLRDHQADPPTSTDALNKLMYSAFGGTHTTVIPFSRAPAYTDLEEPRFVFMANSSELFVAAIPRKDGTVEMEFIAWNPKQRAYDFGIVGGFGTKAPRVEVVDRNKCTICHITQGPIFVTAGWSGMLVGGSKASRANRVLEHAVAKVHSKRIKDVSEYFAKEKANGDRFDSSHFGLNGASFDSDGRGLEGSAINGAMLPLLVQIIRNAGQEDRAGLLRNLLQASVCLENDVEERHEFERNFELLFEKEVQRQKIIQTPVLLKDSFLSQLRGEGDTPIPTIQEIEKLSSNKRLSKLSNSTPETSPTKHENFEPESRPLDGKDSYGFLSPITQRFATVLHLPGNIDWKEFCKSPRFEELVTGKELPFRNEFLNSNGTMGTSALTVRKKHEGGKCNMCHGDKSQPDLYVSFELSSLDNWKDKLNSKSDSDRSEVRKWRTKTLEALRTGAMPPKGQSPLEPDLRKELIELLR